MVAVPQPASGTSAAFDAPTHIALGSRLSAQLEDGMAAVEPRLRDLLAAGLDRLPWPGGGDTLERWRCLERVARHDLSLVKLYESHVDALAILHELGHDADVEADAVHAVWAAEAREPLRVHAVDAGLGDGALVRLEGAKAWCSGARSVDVGLVTVTDDAGGRWLARVAMRQTGVAIDDDGWHAVGMRDSRTATLRFRSAVAHVVGPRGGYLERPGFWYGGIGVASCWFGAAADIASRVRDLQVGRDDVHALGHLGAIDADLAAAAASLRACAVAVDAPGDDPLGAHDALRVRAFVAACCERVMREAAHAVGPGPLCSDARLARHMADLPVFIRQMRAEHDLVAQSRALLARSAAPVGEAGWSL